VVTHFPMISDMLPDAQQDKNTLTCMLEMNS